MSFLAEIRRRRVFQVAAVYAVVAWLLVQIVATVEEPLGLPAWFDAGVIVLLLVGFPIALILSWAFDLTPEGLKSVSGVRRSGEIVHTSGQRLTYVSHALVLLAVGFLVADQYLLRPRTSPSAESSIGAPSGQSRVNRFDYDLPENQSFRGAGRSVMALSRDGRQFVYNTPNGLYLRSMGELEAQQIPLVEPELLSPSFSPDGQSIVYFEPDAGELKRVPVTGGAPVVIAELESNPWGVSWENDGTILIGQFDGIYRVPADAGVPELVIPTGAGIRAYGPRLLPDGHSVLFSVGPDDDWDEAEIVVESLSTGERTVLVEGGSDARYVPTGHLVYALGDALFAVPVDVESLTVSGGAVPLVQGVMRANAGQSAVANYDISDDGTLVYVTGRVAIGGRTLVWVDREGGEDPIVAPPRSYTSPRISPDGTTVALNARDEELDIWTWDLARETLTRVTFDPEEDEFPVWSPDGRRIAFSSSRGGGNISDTAVFWQAADGTGSAERIAAGSGQMFPTGFLPDASAILVFGSAEGNDNIGLVRVDGDDPVTPLLDTRFGERMPEVSPDGRWLTYTSDESGRDEVYVRPFPGIDAGRWQVSTGGGVQPLWARDGETLFYRSGDAMMSVSIETDPGFAAGTPEVVFEGEYFGAQGGRSYDVSPGDGRFLMIKSFEDTSATSQFIIVQNWLQELERLVRSSE